MTGPGYGEQLKLDGMAEAQEAVPEWADRARAALYDLALSGEEFTSEELTARVGLPRVDVGQNRNNAVGAVVAAASRAGLIERVGYRRARRPALHAAVVTIWRGQGQP